jgi:hypothetical protein
MNAQILHKLLITTGGLITLYILYKISSHVAGGGSGGLFPLLGIFAISPYYRLYMHTITTLNSYLYMTSQLGIIILGVSLLYSGVYFYGHATPIFIIAAPILQHLLIFVADKLLSRRLN